MSYFGYIHSRDSNIVYKNGQDMHTVFLKVQVENILCFIGKEEEFILKHVYIPPGLYYQYDRQTRMECTLSCCIQEKTKCCHISSEAWS
jgi:hypothetical protein